MGRHPDVGPVTDLRPAARPEAAPAIEARLCALEAEVRELVTLNCAILATLERQQRPSSIPTRADRAVLEKILPAIAGAYGSDNFSSRDLVEDASPAVRLVVRGLSAKRVGKLFSRADGIPINGLMVQRQGEEFHVTAWRVVAC
jgi:hypothetical protein